MKKEERTIYLITIFLVLLIWLLPVLVIKQEVRQEKEIYRLEQSITTLNDNGCK